MAARLALLRRALSVSAVVACVALSGVAIRTLSPAPAAAQTSDTVLENLTFAFGDISYRAPRAEFRGTTLSQTELLRLFDATSPEPLADRVRRLDVASILLPEIISEVTTPQGRQVTTYRDAVFSKVRGGKIASVSAATGSIETTDGKGAVRGSFGRFAIEDLDLDLAVGLFTTKGTPDVALKRIYGAFSVDGLTFTDPSGNPTRIGRLSGRDLSARPTSAGWAETLNALAANPDLKGASPEARRRSIDALSELFDAFAVGAMEATDITFGGRDSNGSGRLSRMAFSGASGARAAEVRVDGFDAGSEGGRVRFSSLSFGGLSMGPLLGALREFGASSGPPSAAVLRGLVPILGDVSMNGLEVDVPGSKTAAQGSPPPMRVSLGQIEVAAGKAVDGIPSDLRFTLRDVSFPVSPNPEIDALKQLASLGYERVVTSLAISLGWNEAAQELVMREVSLDGADIGAAMLRAVIGNVSRDVFNPDTAIASVAALGATAKSAEIGIENRGLFERIIARQAKRQNRNSEDIRREYGMAAAVGIPAILGNSAGAKTLAQAVAKFVAKPGRLVITARAKQPAGYGIADFAAGPDPASVLDALEVTATAE